LYHRRPSARVGTDSNLRRSSSVPRHPEPRPKISACERSPTLRVSVARHAADWQHSHPSHRRAVTPGRRRPNCSLRTRHISSMPAIVIEALRNRLNPSMTAEKRCLAYQIPQAQLEPEIPAHTQHDDLTDRIIDPQTTRRGAQTAPSATALASRIDTLREGVVLSSHNG
jgi:hypothetical protein